ncbi:MAG: hypothetical protein ACC669_00265, partial [bacterium]
VAAAHDYYIKFRRVAESIITRLVFRLFHVKHFLRSQDPRPRTQVYHAIAWSFQFLISSF